MSRSSFINYASFSRFGEKKKGKIQHNTETVGDIVFDSTAEKNRYLELKLLEKRGLITDLVCHPRFEIIPSQKNDQGKTVFRAAHYTADFQYMKDGKLVVEDVKSTYTREEKDYILRRKLMFYVNGIYVEEVIR